MITYKEIKLPNVNRIAELSVMLPNNLISNQSYPVLFFQDGQNIFEDTKASYGVSWGIKEIYESSTMKPVIIIGLSCANGLDRLDEYNPFLSTKPISFGEKPRITGGKGDLYLRDIIETVLPYLKSNYPVDLEDITLIGSSMGGHISLYATLKYPNIFKNALCLSNAFWISEQAMLNFIQNPNTKHHGLIYIDTGDQESTDFDYIQANDAVYKALVSKGLTPIYRIIPGGNHHESDWRVRIKEIIELIHK